MKNWTLNEDKILIEKINEGLTYGEIGDTLGRTAESVRKRWNRIKHLKNIDFQNLNVTPVADVPPTTFRAVVWDIEVESLLAEGYDDRLVCVSFLPLDSEKPYTLKLKWEDNGDDHELVAKVLDELAKYDILIGFNSRAFDENWLHTRAIKYGIKIDKKFQSYDVYQAAKSMALRTHKSLGALSAFFGITGYDKTRIFKGEWTGISSVHRAEFEATMDDIVYHCEQDVLMTKELFNFIYWYDHKKIMRTTKFGY